MLILSRTWKGNGLLKIEYKIGSFFDFLFIKSRKYKFHEKYLNEERAKFMKSIEIEVKKEKKSRAEDMKKSRSKAAFIEARLTPKAEKILIHLCETTGLNKTQVINKLLEEQEQLNLL